MHTRIAVCICPSRVAIKTCSIADVTPAILTVDRTGLITVTAEDCMCCTTLK